MVRRKQVSAAQTRGVRPWNLAAPEVGVARGEVVAEVEVGQDHELLGVLASVLRGRRDAVRYVVVHVPARAPIEEESAIMAMPWHGVTASAWV